MLGWEEVLETGPDGTEWKGHAHLVCQNPPKLLALGKDLGLAQGHMPLDDPLPPGNFPAPREMGCLGTSLTVTDHPGAMALCCHLARESSPSAIEFCNTQIVTLRRSDPEYRRTSECFDRFIPDSSPLLWLLNAAGAGMRPCLWAGFLPPCADPFTAPSHTTFWAVRKIAVGRWLNVSRS